MMPSLPSKQIWQNKNKLSSNRHNSWYSVVRICSVGSRDIKLIESAVFYQVLTIRREEKGENQSYHTDFWLGKVSKLYCHPWKKKNFKEFFFLRG